MKNKKLILILVVLFLTLSYSFVFIYGNLNLDLNLKLQNSNSSPPKYKTSELNWTYEASGEIISVDISRCGKYIVSGINPHNVSLLNYNSNISIWNKEISEASDRIIKQTVISSDPADYVAAICGRRLQLFEKESGEEINHWDLSGIQNYLSVAISHNGSYLAAVSYSGSIDVFKNDTGAVSYWSFDTGGIWLNDIAMTADGRYVIAGGINKAFFCDIIDKKSLWNFTTDESITKVAISKFKNYTIDNSGNYTVAIATTNKLYLRDSNNESKLIYNNEAEISTLSLSSTGKYIVLGDVAKKTKVFRNCKFYWDYTIPNSEIISSTAMSSYGDFFVVGVGQTLMLFNSSFKEKGGPVSTIELGGNINAVAISSNSSYMIAGCDNNKTYLYNNILEGKYSDVKYGDNEDLDDGWVRECEKDEDCGSGCSCQNGKCICPQPHVDGGVPEPGFEPFLFIGLFAFLGIVLIFTYHRKFKTKKS